jgi:UDP-N-acetylmuramate dehydrogenase
MDSQIRELCNEACGFSYRTSIFNTTERGRFIILRVSYALVRGGEPHIEYGDLRRYFEGGQSTPTLAEVREAVRQIRARKGMLIVEGDPDSRSAGSFFKNPVLSDEKLADLMRRAVARKLTVPSYPALAQRHKVSAAWLVEHSGLSRGFALGHAGISSKHALALVNRGGATAAEILALKDRIQNAVEQQWGIQLQPEPLFVGVNP